MYACMLGGGKGGSSPMDVVLDLLDSTDSTIVVSISSKKGGKVLVAIGEYLSTSVRMYVCFGSRLVYSSRAYYLAFEYARYVSMHASMYLRLCMYV